MTEYKCSRCGFKTKYKHVLIRHLLKKLECPTTLSSEPRDTLLENLNQDIKLNDITYNCRFCSKKFNFLSNCYRHENICKSKDLDTRLATLEERLKNLAERPMITQNITNNTQNTQNIIINVRDFGKEDLSSCVENMDLVRLL